MSHFRRMAQRGASSRSISLARARSLVGVARTADKLGDAKQATEAYSKLAKIWSQADAGSAEVREAQDYLKRQK